MHDEERCREVLQVGIEKQEENGFCFPVVEDKATGMFLGFCGLNIPFYEGPLPGDPCLEIGRRLLPETWGKGIAVEAAKTWLRFGFETLELQEIIAITVVQNHRSRRVMEKLGMTYDNAEDFDFPGVEVGHPLCRHVLYRLQKQRFFGD